jgi:hypothetical protein
MAGTARLELATSAVTDALSCAGLRRINRLDVRLSATVGFVGQGWLAFVQRFVQPPFYPLPQSRGVTEVKAGEKDYDPDSDKISAQLQDAAHR